MTDPKFTLIFKLNEARDILCEERSDKKLIN